MTGKVIKAIERTQFDTAGLGLPFVALNPLGLTESCFLLRLINQSDTGVTISYDGVDAHDYIRADSTSDLLGSSSLQGTGITGAWRKGAKVYVSGIAGVGHIFLAGYYLANQGE